MFQGIYISQQHTYFVVQTPVCISDPAWQRPYRTITAVTQVAAARPQHGGGQEGRRRLRCPRHSLLPLDAVFAVPFSDFCRFMLSSRYSLLLLASATLVSC